MLVAIVVAILTLIVAALVAVAFFALRERLRTSSSVHVKRGRASISSIDTLDVASASSSTDGLPDTHVKTSSSPDGRASAPLNARFAAIGVFAAGVFATLGAKLFGMQILQASSYQKQANENKYTDVSTPAPRGYIYDADGVALVKNRSSLTVLADADVLSDHDVVLRLSAVLGIPYNVVRSRLQETSSGAQSQRVIASDASLRNVAFIAEHSDAFPGVNIQNRTIRSYPYGALAAHVLGYTGAVSDADLKSVPANRDIELGDEVGKSGVEYTYDEILSGEHGRRRVVADADGNVVRVVAETQPTRGSDLYLTIKAPVQYVVDKELAELIAPKGVIGTGKGVAGACVVMDVTDGSIVAMSSYPTYSPETFIGGISQDIWDLYSSKSSYYPLLNRTISGTYAAASTFKSFTGLAALRYGFADTSKYWTCTGSWDGFNTGSPQKCWLKTGHGSLDFKGGIVQSCDVVFYDIAYNFYYAGKSQGGTLSDTAMQEEPAKFRFGQLTGIDLASEEAGRIPTPEWKQSYWADVPTEGVWRGGDMTNTVIGQGDVLVTPIQVAVAYGAIATGNLMRPHVLKEVRNGDNVAAVTFEPQIIDVPDVDEKNYAILRDALNGVAGSNSTLAKSFRDVGMDPWDVACKTGTAEMTDTEDFGWFACYAPYDDPKYVVAVMIEQGGGGSTSAGPIGAKALAAALAADAGELKEVGAVAASSGESVAYVSSSSGRTD